MWTSWKPSPKESAVAGAGASADSCPRATADTHRPTPRNPLRLRMCDMVILLVLEPLSEQEIRLPGAAPQLGQGRPSAFARNTAICARVNGALGQKFSGLHPAVMPDAWSASLPLK